MRNDIVPGAVFPDYELTDHSGTRQRLSALQGNDPLILVLARGAYCPRDHRQHVLLAEMEIEIRIAFTKIVTISTDNILRCREWRDSLGVSWPFLSDERRSIQKDLDIQEYTDPYHNPMIPHTFVLEPGLVIYTIYNGYWYWGRPTPDDLRHDLRAVTSRTSTDWDLAAPGLRERWDAGDKTMFWPYSA